MQMGALESGGCAFVTGGSRGIGAAISHVLAAAGWPVVVGYSSRADVADQTMADIEKAGGRGMTVGGDLRDQDVVERVFDEIEQKFDRVAVLVNNAGMRADGLLLALDDYDWTDVIDTNLTVAYRTSKRALGSMVRARHGRIINVTSVLADRSIPGAGNYSVSKAGLAGLTRALAVEVAHKGVTVNEVAPGLLETDLTRDVSHLHASAQTAVPMRRLGRPEEIASCVRFLASPEASYITGQTLAVDGGLSAMSFNIRGSDDVGS